MSNVVSLFPSGEQFATKREPAKAYSCANSTKHEHRKTLVLTAEAARFAHAIKSLSTISHEKVDLYQHLTYKNEIELTKNMEKAVKLLLRFAKELKLNVHHEDSRNSEPA